MGHMSATTITAITAVGISGSPSPRSKSRLLLEHALGVLAEHGASTSLVDLATLPADALLGRVRSASVDDALAVVGRATIVAASTPVYRATYTGLLKVFFDLMPLNGLAGKTAIAIATGGAPAHQLVIDYGLRPLFASVGALTAPTGIYGTDASFEQDAPQQNLLHRIAQAVAEAIALADRLQPALPRSSSTIAGS